MTAYEEVLQWDAPREEWLAARREGVSASDIAAVLGISPWESPASLWYRKRGELDEVDVTDEMLWGTLLEPVIADRFAAQHEEFLTLRCGLLRSTERLWQLATPDRLLHEATGERGPGGLGERIALVAPLEVKTAYDLTGWGPEGTDEIPVYYRTQVLWQMDVLGVRSAFVALLSGGSNYREYEITYDSNDVAIMRDAAEAFWQSVLDGVRPDLDAHDATTRVMKDLHPDVEDVNVTIAADLADEYRAAREAYAAAELRKKTAENRMRDAIGDGKRAVLADGTRVATRSVYDQDTFDAKRFKADRPELAKSYTGRLTINKLIAAPKPRKKADA